MPNKTKKEKRKILEQKRVDKAIKKAKKNISVDDLPLSELFSSMKRRSIQKKNAYTKAFKDRSSKALKSIEDKNEKVRVTLYDLPIQKHDALIKFFEDTAKQREKENKRSRAMILKSTASAMRRTRDFHAEIRANGPTRVDAYKIGIITATAVGGTILLAPALTAIGGGIATYIISLTAIAAVTAPTIHALPLISSSLAGVMTAAVATVVAPGINLFRDLKAKASDLKKKLTNKAKVKTQKIQNNQKAKKQLKQETDQVLFYEQTLGAISQLPKEQQKYILDSLQGKFKKASTKKTAADVAQLKTKALPASKNADRIRLARESAGDFS